MRYVGIEGHSESRFLLRISIAEMTVLKVRTTPADGVSCEQLYQSMPEFSIPLMATIPAGTAAVSIPQQNGRYPIAKSLPDAGSGFVIAYSRRENGRYEASEILYHDRSFTIPEFMALARRWKDDHAEVLSYSDQYAYFSPSREEWGVILRDGGFALFNPSAMDFALTEDIIRKRKAPSNCGIIARLPVLTTTKAGLPPFLPAFAQVELALEESPGPAYAWTSYFVYQKMQALQSRPPEKIMAPLREWLRTLTAEAGFASWSFRKGMYFGDHIEWWNKGNRRRTTHEGIDFTQGCLADGSLGELPEGTPVRAIESGELVSILDDFLNRTLLVRHSAIQDASGNVFHTLLSHIQPEAAAPCRIEKGEILGKVAKSRNVSAPAHLHLSGAWIPPSIPPEAITIDMISVAFAPIILVNFNCILGADVSGRQIRK
jgi:hypothetical protein